MSCTQDTTTVARSDQLPDATGSSSSSMSQRTKAVTEHAVSAIMRPNLPSTPLLSTASSLNSITSPTSSSSLSLDPTADAGSSRCHTLSNTVEPCMCNDISALCARLANLSLAPPSWPTSLPPFPPTPAHEQCRPLPYPSLYLYDDPFIGPTRNPRTRFCYDPYEVSRRARDAVALISLLADDEMSDAERAFWEVDLKRYSLWPVQLRWQGMVEGVQWAVKWGLSGCLVPHCQEEDEEESFSRLSSSAEAVSSASSSSPPLAFPLSTSWCSKSTAVNDYGYSDGGDYYSSDEGWYDSEEEAGDVGDLTV